MDAYRVEDQDLAKLLDEFVEQLRDGDELEPRAVAVTLTRTVPGAC